MSIKSELYYTVICDAPGCGVSADEDSEYSSWADVGQAYDVAVSAEDWALTDDDGDYCPEHSFFLASDDGYDDKYVPLHTVPFDLRIIAAVHAELARAERRFEGVERMLGKAPSPVLIASGGWCSPSKNVYDLAGTTGGVEAWDGMF